MQTTLNIKNLPTQSRCDDSVIIKLMRIHKGLSRKEAGLLFGVTFNAIEKLENGRGKITLDRFRRFKEAYEYSDRDIELIRTGKFLSIHSPNQRKKLSPKTQKKYERFRKKIITKESRALKELRTQTGKSQYEASRNCGYNEKALGQIENGRVNLTQQRIEHIVKTLGFTMEYFNQLLKEPILRHELEESCIKIVKKMDANELRTAEPVLSGLCKRL